MYFRILLSIAGIFISSYFFAQNLVPNSDFEIYQECPNGYAQFYKTTAWQSANAGSPDYYNCTFRATQPFLGDGMMGLILHGDYEEITEYAQVKLTQPLIAGQEYCISFYTLADTNNFININKIGLLISENEIKKNTWTPILENPQIMVDSVIHPKRGWTKISGEHIALGGESYITIGNFFPPHQFIKEQGNLNGYKKGWYSYYYIDQVKVTPLNNQFCCECEEEPKVMSTQINNDPYREIIYFNFDSWTLTKEENSKLEKLTQVLQQKKITKITIDGHTDNKGTKDYNIWLSEKRANFIQSGLKKMHDQKISFNINWFGEEVPATSNSSDQNRKLNRRVEITLQ